MQAGDLREWVTIQVSTLSQRTTGSQTRTWATLARVQANVKPVKGVETERAAAVTSPQTYLVTIRYRDDVSTTNRLLWGTVLLNIRSVSNRDERRVFLTLEAEAGVVS